MHLMLDLITWFDPLVVVEASLFPIQHASTRKNSGHPKKLQQDQLDFQGPLIMGVLSHTIPIPLP